MPVYIDNEPRGPGILTLHWMIADTNEELVAMLQRMGRSDAFIVQRGNKGERVEMCTHDRDSVVSQGATTMTLLDIKRMIAARPRY